jgi:hypothetical protein
LRAILQARNVGPIAFRAIKNLKAGFVGEVAASFTNSFYIRTSNDELIFVTGLPVKSPITVNLNSSDDFERLLRPPVPVFFEKAELRVGDDLTVDLRGASTQPDQPDLSTLQIGQLQEALYTAATILTIVDTHQSVLDQASIAYSGAEQFVRTGILSLRDTGDSEPFLETAEEIVGLGPGFTPSGDDVLGGLLGTYNSLSRAVRRPKILLDFESLKKSTNWISAKLLDYMQREVFDDQVAHLVRSAGSGNKEEFIVALETLLPRGHTSGVDISVGALLALSVLRDVASNGHEIVRRLGFSYESHDSRCVANV